MSLSSFSPGSTALVVGASGGIGAAFVAALRESGRFDTVHEAARGGPIRVDYDEPETVANLDDLGPLDLVIVATGMLHEPSGEGGRERGPEKSMPALRADWMARNMAVNAVGPMMVAARTLPQMRRDTRSVFAALSARVGSISDNRLGGWHSYRMSKAALNMGLVTLAIEHARRWPEGVVCGLHPGTVDTDLSEPFQRGVKRLFTPEESAGKLLDVIDGLAPADTGGVFDHAGERIPA